MKIKIERTTCTDKSTLGNISIDGFPLGKVVEPVTIENAEPGQPCAIGDGVYEVKVVSNPKAGTPTIKVYGKYIPHNVAIRSLQPFAVTNVSPSFWNEEDNEIDNISRWAKLLSMLVESNEDHTLTITSPPSPPGGLF